MLGPADQLARVVEDYLAGQAGPVELTERLGRLDDSLAIWREGVEQLRPGPDDPRELEAWQTLRSALEAMTEVLEAASIGFEEGLPADQLRALVDRARLIEQEVRAVQEAYEEILEDALVEDP
ncbi:MAG: hypothetical protein AB7S38_23550 [Vulcanimicrobiota bacterium]